MTPRALSFVAVALLAVGASAAVTTQIQWSMTTKVNDNFRVLKTDNGIYFAWDITGATMTHEEAASLGRALLEAAGQPEKVCPAPALCPSTLSTYGCVTITPSLHFITTEYQRWTP